MIVSENVHPISQIGHRARLEDINGLRDWFTPLIYIPLQEDSCLSFTTNITLFILMNIIHQCSCLICYVKVVLPVSAKDSLNLWN